MMDAHSIIPVEQLADEFAERCRRGERPSVEEYAERYPVHAEIIRETFEALAMMEDLAPASDDSLGQPSRSSGPVVGGATLEQLGDYRIIREVGRGGMGVVYEAEQVSLGRHVALKVLPRQLMLDVKQKRRFEREAKAAAKLHNTNIVPVFGVGEADGLHYYVMQFIQGLGLDEVLDEVKRLQDESPRSLPATGIQLPVSRRQNISAADVARSLMTGGFQTIIGDSSPDDDVADADRFGSTIGLEPDRGVSNGTGLTPSRQVGDSTANGRLSDTFSQSGPVSLPGQAPSEIDTKKQRRQFTYWESVANMGVQVASALQYAHDQGIQHRDIKPSNLLLDLRGTVWVTDFGLAKSDDQQNITHTGDILGTLRYMPPEAFEGKTDARSDIYSLGLTLYEMLALQPAFDERDRNRLIRQVTQEAPQRLEKLNPEIPRDLVTVIHKSIDRDAAHRYQSGREFAEDLQRFIDDEPIHARRISLAERFTRWSRHNKALAASLAVVASLMLFVAISSSVAAGYFQSLSRDLTIAKGNADESAAKANSDRDAAKRAQLAEQKIAVQAKADREIARRDSYRSTMLLVDSMLQGDVQSRYRAVDILWKTPPGLRGWEWGYLMARCPLERWSLQTNQGGLDTLAASADGRFLATAGVDGTVALWDSWTRKELWRQKTGRAQSLAIDSRGRYVGIGSADESQPSLRILKLTDGRLVHQGESKGLAYVAFSRSGRDLYVSGKHALDRFTSDQSGSFTRVARRGWEAFNTREFPRRRKLFVDVADAIIGVHNSYNFPDRRFEPRTLRRTDKVDGLAALFDRVSHGWADHSIPVLHTGLGKYVYSEGDMVWENTLNSRTRKRTRSMLIAHPTTVEHLAYDPRSGTVLAASNDGMVTHRNTAGETSKFSHGAPICGFALLPDGRCVTAGADGLLKCWNPGTTTRLASNRDGKMGGATANLVAFAGNAGKRLFYQNWQDWERAYAKQGYMKPYFPVIRPRSNQLVVSSPKGLSFYRLGSLPPAGKRVWFIDIPRPRSAAFDAAGRLMVVSTDDGQLAVFDLKTNRRLPTPAVRGLGAVAMNPQGTLAALLTMSGLQVWNVSTGRSVHTVKSRSGAGPVAAFYHEKEKDYIIGTAPVFHPDGDLIAFLEKSRNLMSIVLWDSKLGKRRATIHGAPGIEFRSCLFSKDGNRLLTPCNDRKVRIWDWRLGKEVLALSDIGSVDYLAASSDGVTMAYAGMGPSLRIAKALPWTEKRDGGFYRAVDDFRIFTAGLADFKKRYADKEEMYGDFLRRRGEASRAVAHYARAITVRQRRVLASLKDNVRKRRLAALYAKQFAAAETAKANSGTAVLQQAVSFWQQLPSDASSRQYLFDAQVRLVDRRLADNDKGVMETLKAALQSWSVHAAKKPNDRFVTSAVRVLMARLVWGTRSSGDLGAIDRLVTTHPVLATEAGMLLADFARRVPGLSEPMVNEARAKARAWFQHKLAKEPANSVLAGELGLLLLEEQEKNIAADRERYRVAALKIAAPWDRLAAAYYLLGDKQNLDTLVKQFPRAVVGIGDLYLATQEWDRAIAEYRKPLSGEPANTAALRKLETAFRSAGRTRDVLPYLVKASVANPKGSMLFWKVAVLQAWFGQRDELSRSRMRILAAARGTNAWPMAARAAGACCFLPWNNKKELKEVLSLGRAAVRLTNGGAGKEWALLVLGMAELRNGNNAAAERALLAAERANPKDRNIAVRSALFRAIMQFRQGKKDEARKLALAAEARMKPFPKDKNNPLADNTNYYDLATWLAHREAKAMIQFGAVANPGTKPKATEKRD